MSSRTVTHATAPTSTTTVYVHDLSDRIIAELSASGQTLREYIWLDDMPVAVVDNVASGNPVIYYVHVDHLMRPARLTAQDTSWVWDVIYAPFGGVWPAAGFVDTEKRCLYCGWSGRQAPPIL